MTGHPTPVPVRNDVMAAAIIVAAGSGQRFGAANKVLVPVGGRPALQWVLKAFTSSRAVREIVVVAGMHTADEIRQLVAETGSAASVVTGGDRRQDSVAAGLAAVTAPVDVVVIHDGARPLVPMSLINVCIAAAAASGAAIAAAPVTDTIKRVDLGGTIVETIPRDALWAAQTPQAFDLAILRRLVATPDFRQRSFTDEAALFEAYGYPVTIVPSREPNPKLTVPSDIAVIDALLASRNAVAAPEST